MRRSRRTNGRSRYQTFESLESRQMLAIGGTSLNIDGPGLETGKRVAFTPDGGYVTAGLFGGTVDFDPGAGVANLTALSDTDIYIAKYSSSGAFQWAKQIGGAVLPGVINSQGVIDFAADPGRPATTFYNGVGSDPRNSAENINDLKIASDGGIVLCGSFIGTVDLDPGPGKRVFSTYDMSYPDAFLMKLTSTGALAWADHFGGHFTDTAGGIAFDSSGSIFMTGQFSRVVNFSATDPSFTRTAAGRTDIFVMKTSPTGIVRWVDTFGGIAIGQTQREAGNSIAIDLRGNVFVVGTFIGTADFDPSPTAIVNLTAVGATDGYLLKLNNHGEFMNVVKFGNSGYNGLTSVAVDATNSPVIAGYFQGSNFDADPGAGTHNISAALSFFTDGFVEKLNPNLQFQWVQQLNGTGYELMEQLKIDSTGSIVIGGSYYGSAVFGLTGPTLTSFPGSGTSFFDYNDSLRISSYDPFLWKLSSTGTTTWVQTWGSSGDDIGTGIDIASDNSILFTGRFHGSVDFDPGPGTRRLRSRGISNTFVTQFDAGGIIL